MVCLKRASSVKGVGQHLRVREFQRATAGQSSCQSRDRDARWREHVRCKERSAVAFERRTGRENHFPHTAAPHPIHQARQTSAALVPCHPSGASRPPSTWYNPRKFPHARRSSHRGVSDNTDDARVALRVAAHRAQFTVGEVEALAARSNFLRDRPQRVCQFDCVSAVAGQQEVRCVPRSLARCRGVSSTRRAAR